MEQNKEILGQPNKLLDPELSPSTKILNKESQVCNGLPH